MTSMTKTALASRRPDLQDKLLQVVDLLNRRLASEIASEDIDDYVALHWLEWNGGGLRLTTTGENICKQMRALLAKT